jgi:hypothetical protein
VGPASQVTIASGCRLSVDIGAMSKLASGETVQVVVSAPSRFHPLTRGVLRRSRIVTDDVAGTGGTSTVLWSVETSEGKTFEIPEAYLARIEEE